MDREAGLPFSLPVSSIDVLLEVDEAELGSGLVGSLVTSADGDLVKTCAETKQRGEKASEHNYLLLSLHFFLI